LPALECAGVREFVSEGDVLRIDFATGTVENLTQKTARNAPPMPEFLQAIVRSGGIRERLKAEGYL
jgi:3-isopropylmalate/(R)-2-methylmalate dehydratase small subunit